MAKTSVFEIRRALLDDLRISRNPTEWSAWDRERAEVVDRLARKAYARQDFREEEAELGIVVAVDGWSPG